MPIFRSKTSAPALSSQSAKNGIGCPIVFGLVFGTFGMFFVVMFFLWPLWGVLQALTWIETPCTIEESHVETKTNAQGKGKTYSVAVRFSFQAPDPNATGGEAPLRTWTGERYSFVTGSSSGLAAKQAAVEAYPAGSKRTCWVDPRDPQCSVLERDMTGDLWMAALTLIFPCAGYGIALGIWVASRRKRQRERMISTGTMPTPTAAQETAATLALGSVQSPFAKFIFSLIFCVFWNGIISIPLFSVLIPGFRQGHPEWIIFFFLIPFELIGLGLMVWLGYNLLALANPRIRLRLAATSIRPGDRLQLSWEIAGSAQRLRRLTITLEGREEATYSQGKKQVTDREVFHRSVLFDRDEHFARQPGRAELLIPAEAPVSFKSLHHCLRWVMVVQGDIPHWPDIREEWDLTVLPPTATVPVAPLALAGNVNPADDQTLAIILGASPDGHVAGEVAWNLLEKPDLFELRLFWFTAGRGTLDVEVVDRLRLDDVDLRGRRAFDLNLPHAPRPFAGKLVAITWALELVAEPGGQVARLNLPVGEGH